MDLRESTWELCRLRERYDEIEKPWLVSMAIYRRCVEGSLGEKGL